MRFDEHPMLLVVTAPLNLISALALGCVNRDEDYSPLR